MTRILAAAKLALLMVFPLSARADLECSQQFGLITPVRAASSNQSELDKSLRSLLESEGFAFTARRENRGVSQELTTFTITDGPVDHWLTKAARGLNSRRKIDGNRIELRLYSDAQSPSGGFSTLDAATKFPYLAINVQGKAIEDPVVRAMILHEVSHGIRTQDIIRRKRGPRDLLARLLAEGVEIEHYRTVLRFDELIAYTRSVRSAINEARKVRSAKPFDAAAYESIMEIVDGHADLYRQTSKAAHELIPKARALLEATDAPFIVEKANDYSAGKLILTIPGENGAEPVKLNFQLPYAFGRAPSREEAAAAAVKLLDEAAVQLARQDKNNESLWPRIRGLRVAPSP